MSFGTGSCRKNEMRLTGCGGCHLLAAHVTERRWQPVATPGQHLNKMLELKVQGKRWRVVRFPGRQIKRLKSNSYLVEINQSI